MVLGANETYTGPTAITAGTLQLGNGGTTGSIALSTGASSVVVTAGALAIDRSDNVTLGTSLIGNGGIVSGAGGLTQVGTGTLTVNTAQTYNGTTSIIGGGTLDLAAPAGSLNTTATGTALTFSNLGGTFIYDNTGSTGTDSQAMGVLTTTAGEDTVQSTFGTSGTATLTFSTLAARTAGATLNFVNSGGTVGTPGVAGNTVFNFTTSPGTGFISAGDFFNGSNYAVYDTTNGTVRAFNYASDTGGVIVNTNTSLANTATNNVQLTTSITAQGTATINTLNIVNSSTAPTLTLNTGASTLTLAGILVSGGTTATIARAGTGTLAIGAEGVIRTDQASDSLNITSVVSGTALTKSGAGTLTLGGTAAAPVTNTYTGTTTLDAGTLDINSAGALGNGGAFLINSGSATIDNTSGAAVTTSTHALTLDGDFTFGGTNALTLTTTGTSVVSLGTNEESSRVITTNGSAALTINGNIINGTNTVLPTFGLTKAGSGTLNLNGSDSYTGATVVNAGTLLVTGAAAAATVQTGSAANGSPTVSGLTSTANLVVGEFVSGTNIVTRGIHHLH